MRSCARPGDHPHVDELGDGLTARKRQVLELVATGCANKEIAAQLGITSWGVEKHLRHLFRQYGVPNRAALVHAASRRGHLAGIAGQG